VSNPVQSWLMYWRPDTNRSGLLDHAASDQLGKVRAPERKSLTEAAG
jgi:hypothetical protein